MIMSLSGCTHSACRVGCNLCTAARVMSRAAHRLQRAAAGDPRRVLGGHNSAGIQPAACAATRVLVDWLQVSIGLF